MQIEATDWSSMGPVTKMIRSFSRREGKSYPRSPRVVYSTTIGQKVLV